MRLGDVSYNTGMTSHPDRQKPFRPDNQSSRERIFERIRNARSHGSDQTQAQSLRQRMADTGRGPQPAMPASLVDNFVERALTLSCTVDRLQGFDQVAPAILAYLQARQLPAQLVAWPALAGEGWLAELESLGVAVRLGAPVGDDLVGLSAAACAVAETGTLVLRSSPQTPASTHLLPETHIAVLHTSDVVLTLEDAFERLKAAGQAMPRALNLVSGPSRTGDIEQTIVLGAHGPYRVHLVLVGQA